MFDGLIALDTKLFLLINHALANPALDVIFVTITNGLFWIIPGAVAAALFIKCKKKEALIVLGLMLITVGISDPVCNQIIKPAVHRLRPCNPNVTIEHARYLLGRKKSLSFPSSHAMNMFAQAMLLTLLYRRRWYWFFGFAAIIGFSRVYVGVHYPLDVLGGAVFGTGIGALVHWGYFAVKQLIILWQKPWNRITG